MAGAGPCWSGSDSRPGAILPGVVEHGGSEYAHVYMGLRIDGDGGKFGSDPAVPFREKLSILL